jgi:hypothetical protein
MPTVDGLRIATKGRRKGVIPTVQGRGFHGKQTRNMKGNGIGDWPPDTANIPVLKRRFVKGNSTAGKPRNRGP